MKIRIAKIFIKYFLVVSFGLLLVGCFKSKKKTPIKETNSVTYPSDVIPFMDEWKILLGDGEHSDDLLKYSKKDFFYVSNDGKTNWVVYKTPNAGITSKTSSNTRTELGQKKHWIPEIGGKLTGTLKVQHVSTSGDARVAASYSVVVGQIHSDEGHENEPIKIFYKKFPRHKKGSVFWNYEINTKGDNSKRWDYSTAVWGNDMSVVGENATSYPKEPIDGIELGEEFSYEINVYKGIMYLTFKSEGHETIKFTKNLLKSDFSTKEDIPQQIWTLYAAIGRDGVERENAYAGEIQYFKQGAYNQTNGKNPEDNIVWYTGSETYNGDIAKQYANGCYSEVWFKEATVGAGTPPKN
ncbi:Alginate lyase [Polaribacter sp. KT25b]|uniref:polysaccharide lyase family 7 protein n=1 Tax=Polaribacter sp. KT25b TaxID=1855336 RepID=UPI00087B44D7|nr:polysaccharide lyase family 7 protein [Polaribacter sp. KT25b]SDS57622.1 Alginate lyase [Polaribacter sp. KT25b]